MPKLALRFSVRAVLALVVVAAVNLAAARATSRHYPRPRVWPTRSASGDRFFVNGEDGSHTVYMRDTHTGRLDAPRVIHPPRPTLLRVWSPVIASSAVTFAVLAIAILRKRRIRPGPIALAAALLMTNLAAAVVTASYYPRPELLWSSEGLVWNSPVPETGRSYTIYQGKVFEKDGKLTRELLSTRPTLLRIWSPVIASSLITLVILTFAALHKRRVASCPSGPPDDSRFEPS